MCLLQLSLDINSIRSKYEEEQKGICDLRILSSNINISNPNQLKSLAKNIIICNNNNRNMLEDIRTLANRLLDIIRNNQNYKEELEQEINSNIKCINNTLKSIRAIYNDYSQEYRTGEFINIYRNNYNDLISDIIELHDKNKNYLDTLSILLIKLLII